MEFVKLSDLCDVIKGETGINKAIPGYYPLVVTSEERKSHNSFQFDTSAVIIPLVSSTGHGHASLKRIHFQEGKFALGSILCAVVPKDNSIINANFLYYYLNLVKEKELVGRMRGMANVTLPIREIEKVPIPVLSIDEQKEFVEFYNNLELNAADISYELTHQLSLISQLRQAFLREAMQGTLVSNETSDDKTGADLLAEIKAEKEQLTKEKKIKKGKPLPPISKEEIPFDIPEELSFIRLGEIFKVEKGKIGIQKAEKSGSIPLVVTSEERQSHNEIHFDGPSVIIPLVSSTGHGHASMKRIHYQEGSFAVGNILGCIQTFLPEFFNMKFLFHYLDTYKQTFFVEKMKGAANVSLKLSSIEETPIPLIRKEIQDKYEELILHLENLEASVKESQNYNAQLLQQVLREALEGKEESKEEAVALVAEEKPQYQAAKIYTISDMAILAGHTINQLSTSNNKDLGRVKLLKMMHLVQYHCQLETPLHFQKKTAGPYTSDLENQIERKLKQHRFFEIKKEKLKDFEKITYLPLAASSSLETIFPREFADKANDINELLSKFRSKNTAFCERVSTMYAVWNNRLLKKETITNELLKADFLQWDEGKKKFESDLEETLDWMRRNGVVPVGFGELI